MDTGLDFYRDKNIETSEDLYPVTMTQINRGRSGSTSKPNPKTPSTTTPKNAIPISKLHYLRLMETQPLNWSNGSFNYPNMVRVGTIADGSCFFHAIALSYFIPYRRGTINSVALNRQKFVRDLRNDLSIKLGEKINPQNPSSPIHYDILSRGALKEFSKKVPQYSLENMQKELNSTHPVDHSINEFISNVLNKDLYILDFMKEDVYVTGDDFEILYKGRESIVLLYLPGHFEVVGITTPSGVKTLFSPDHEFILSIRDRLREKIALGSQR